VHQSRDFILEGAEMLKEKKTISAGDLMELMARKYSHISHLKMMN
jgi:hypothetical protein